MAKKIRKPSPGFLLETWDCEVTFTRGQAKTRADSHWVVKPPQWFTPGAIVSFSVWPRRHVGMIISVERSREDSSLQMTSELDNPKTAVERAGLRAYVLCMDNGNLYFVALCGGSVVPYEFK
jgi:hypothetical protein